MTVRHLNDGALRRLHDDRFAGSNRERDHLAGCERCQRHAARVAADADVANQLFASPMVGVPSSEQALAQLRRRVAAGDRPHGADLPTPRPHGRRRWALGAVAVPVVVAGLVVSANAAGWLSIFSPTQVAPITLTAGQLNGLPDLSQYGKMVTTNLEPRQVSGPAQAAASTGLTVLEPSSLPAGVPGPARWEVIGQGTATFTLDSATAAAAAAKAGRAAPVIPGSLEGTTVTVNAGPAVVAVYGGNAQATGSSESPPTLVIAEGVRPTVSTNGASLQQLEDFLVAQPGISPELAAEIRAIGVPGSTLPIPVISGVMNSQTVQIDNAQGVLVGDSTGLGSALIWEKNNVVYAVGGLLPQSEVLDFARSLR
ncbi:MAG: hypothetical protein DLM65_04040 [Candidatus Aeolococcus gillhamiae]|uniref:DUF4367 domain-containing protein n=1 Tax=Candidatus Aeolococcus gillhamiae TaxID=3127015 RepID=A0A2W5ZAG4_9BACT|nr:MAG: hypothetical protein DLM65_04040 [Candidatus Dormibacter sp. RRmetagenome_bin12]